MTKPNVSEAITDSDHGDKTKKHRCIDTSIASEVLIKVKTFQNAVVYNEPDQVQLHSVKHTLLSASEMTSIPYRFNELRNMTDSIYVPFCSKLPNGDIAKNVISKQQLMTSTTCQK